MAVAANQGTRQDNIPRGMLCMLGGTGLFAMLLAIGKLQSHYPFLELVFFRSLVALIPTLIIAWTSGGMRQLRTHHPAAQAFRATAWFGSICFYFLMIRYLPIATATAIGFAAPLVVTALSGPWLGERVGAQRWAAVIFGLLGTLLLVRPSADATLLGTLFALANVLCYALGSISIRAARGTETAAALSFYSFAGAAAVTGATLPFLWETPLWKDMPALLSLGLVGGLAQYLTTEGFRCAPAATVSPLIYSQILWTVPLGYVLWGELPDAAMIAGVLVIVASGLYLLRYEQRQKTAPAAPAVDAAGPSEP
jgi:drug/metabolite transporter (DMT)-like permease